MLGVHPGLLDFQQHLRRLEGKIQKIVDAALAKVPAMAEAPAIHPLEAYSFEHFDLNGDGIITREEFHEARILGHCLRSLLEGCPDLPELAVEMHRRGSSCPAHAKRISKERFWRGSAATRVPGPGQPWEQRQPAKFPKR